MTLESLQRERKRERERERETEEKRESFVTSPWLAPVWGLHMMLGKERERDIYIYMT